MKNLKKHLCQSGLKSLSVPICVLLLTSAIICTTIFVGCKPEPKTIKIGAILPLTGSAAYFGTHYQNGVNLAFEETKEDLIKQNVKVQFLFEDSQNSDKTAISALNKLLTVDNVNIVISLFPVSEALNPVTTKNPNILHIAATMSPGITEPENTMRIYFNQEQEGMKIVEFCLKKGMRKVFIIHNPIKAQEVEVKEWIIPPLKEKNIEVLTEVLPFDTKDAKSQLLKVQHSKPDLLVLIIFPDQIKIVFKALKEMKLNVPILGNISFAYPSDTPIEWLEDVMYVTPSVFVEKIAESENFVQKYREKFNAFPISTSYMGYIALKILNEAIIAGNITSKEIKEYILNKKKFSTIVGEIEFGADRDCLVPVTYGIIKNGKRVPYKF